MSAETKRREILQMLAKGSISAAQAGELLEQVSAEPAAPAEPDPPPAPEMPAAPESPAEPAKKARWLNVRVADMSSGRNKVSVKIPLSLARIGLRMGAKFAPEMDDMDWDEILAQISTSGDQTIVQVEDEQDGELVQVFVS